MKEETKDLKYWKLNAEEDYIKTPISVLRYISELEKSKEMEKQEKIDFADKYGTYLLQGGIMSAATYNETFKSE